MNTAGTTSTTSTITRLSLPPGTSPISASTAPSAKVIQKTATHVARLPEDSKSRVDSGKGAEKYHLPQRKLTQTIPGLITMVPWSHFLSKIGEDYVLTVLCGTSAVYSLNIPLNPEECALALASNDSLEKIAARIRDYPALYDTRHIERR